MQSARVQISDKKEHVLKCFTDADGKLHLVIATAAFGMGIDCPDAWGVFVPGITKLLGGVYPGKWSNRKDGELTVAELYDEKGGRRVNFKVRILFF